MKKREGYEVPHLLAERRVPVYIVERNGPLMLLVASLLAGLVLGLLAASEYSKGTSRIIVSACDDVIVSIDQSIVEFYETQRDKYAESTSTEHGALHINERDIYPMQSFTTYTHENVWRRYAVVQKV